MFFCLDIICDIPSIKRSFLVTYRDIRTGESIGDVITIETLMFGTNIKREIQNKIGSDNIILKTTLIWESH
jgi:hypothetical protein